MKVLIIGAGIAGLTHAIALEKFGYDVEIYEQSHEIKTIGAGLTLAKNALEIYRRLGILSAIEDKSISFNYGGIYKPNLKLISGSKINGRIRGIHRANLHQILLENVDPVSLHLGKQFIGVNRNDQKILALFKDGSNAQGDIIIGADGIHSNVRSHIPGTYELRQSNQTCWRGIADYRLPEEYRNRVVECWGGKSRFGFLPCTKDHVYWFAVYAGMRNKDKDFSTHFIYFDSLIHDIMQSTPENQIHVDRIMDIKPGVQKWFSDRICLIGDAAHATTPNLGQGACQAIEDAYTLAILLNKYGASYNNFRKFQRIRESKVYKIVRQSWTIGKIAHTRNPLLKSLLYSTIRLSPSSMQKKLIDMIYDISYLDSL